jgi:hypothetical protein
MTRFVLALLGALMAAQASSAATPQDTYDALVAKAEQGGANSVDILALRTLYPQLPQYDPYLVVRPASRALLVAFAGGHADQVCPAVAASLKANYVEPILHALRIKCLDGQHLTLQQYMQKIAVIGALTNVVLKTGDGKSLKTAYRLVSFGELGSVVGHYRLALDGIAEITDHGHHYLMVDSPIKVTPPRKIPGAPDLPATPPKPVTWVKLFFNIDAFGASKAPIPKKLFGGKSQ